MLDTEHDVRLAVLLAVTRLAWRCDHADVLEVGAVEHDRSTTDLGQAAGIVDIHRGAAALGAVVVVAELGKGIGACCRSEKSEKSDGSGDEKHDGQWNRAEVGYKDDNADGI